MGTDEHFPNFGAVQLGLGLIGIGRPWGHRPSPVPTAADAVRFLAAAYETGVRYFDTAPSYGHSEERLGIFLRSHQPPGVVIATKWGEDWDLEANAPIIDHTYDFLRRSLDRSFDRLGRVDILQLHKTTPEVLATDDLARAWEYARSCGVNTIGASVSDPASADIVIRSGVYACMQIPLNIANPAYAPHVERASQRGLLVATNRPYAMGAMLHGSAPPSKEHAFAFILRHLRRGVILTGTADAEHLQENFQAFRAACYNSTR